jgi:hypothetical protein
MENISQNPYRLEEYLNTLDETKKQDVLTQKLKEWGKPKEWTLWELKLDHAFSLVLDKPLSEFDPDKEYHVYCDYTIPEHTIALDELTLSHNDATIQKKIAEMVKSSNSVSSTFDKSKSYYSVDPEWAEKIDADHIYDEDICYVLGDDLAKIIEKGLVDLKTIEDTYCNKTKIDGFDEVNIVYRCISGTKLFDAMYSTFFIVGTIGRDRDEKGLVYKESIDGEMEFEPFWENRLKEVEDKRLKEHLLFYFNTDDSARCFGWFYENIPEYSFVKRLISLSSGKLLAHWNNTDGENFSFSIWEMDKNAVFNSNPYIPEVTEEVTETVSKKTKPGKTTIISRLKALFHNN